MTETWTQLADYFALTFEYSTEQITVLVALLDGLVAVEKSTEVHVEEVVYFLTRRLFARCMEGEKVADRFIKRLVVVRGESWKEV